MIDHSPVLLFYAEGIIPLPNSYIGVKKPKDMPPMQEHSDTGFKPTDFDYLLADPQLQMIKAALPYLQLPQQRIISMMIKMKELNRTADLFRDGEISAMGLGTTGSKKASPFEILQVMKPYAGPKDRDMIEMLENMQLMMQAIQITT